MSGAGAPLKKHFMPPVEEQLGALATMLPPFRAYTIEQVAAVAELCKLSASVLGKAPAAAKRTPSGTAPAPVKCLTVEEVGKALAARLALAEEARRTATDKVGDSPASW